MSTYNNDYRLFSSEKSLNRQTNKQATNPRATTPNLGKRREPDF